jgi:hypothetical protein
MVSNRLVGLMLAAGVLTGCVTKSKPVATAPPADTFSLQNITSQVHVLDPDAKVGLVTDVLPGENLAQVSDVNTADFKEGDNLVFIDTNQKTLTSGKVVRIVPDAIHVKYDAPPADGRAPKKGDIAVKFKS